MTEALNRIQKETQRLKDRKRRLAVENQVPVEQEAEESATPRSTTATAAVAAGSPSRLQESRQSDPTSKGLPTAASLAIEASTGGYFEDPVPANQMSSHLKSEHEAFKAR